MGAEAREEKDALILALKMDEKAMAGKGQEKHPSLELPEGTNPTDTLTLAQ